jgi:hypothetical protein
VRHHYPSKVLIHTSRVQQSLDDDRRWLIGGYAVDRSERICLRLDDAVAHQVLERDSDSSGRHRQLSLELSLGVPAADVSG